MVTENIFWEAETELVGETAVLRALPAPGAPAVGPFVFLDHFGPMPARPGTLAAHPHAGIEVMTYLMAGSNEHRDSMGHRGRIRSGGTQWMRAGRGILHAETVLADEPIVHGVQLWARLPASMQDCAPAYRGFTADDAPQWRSAGVDFRLLAGELQGRRGPIELALPALLVHVMLDPGAHCELALPGADHEYGVYGIESRDLALKVEGVTRLARGGFAALKAGTTTLSLAHGGAGPEGCEALVLGGARAPRPLVFGGPFVLDSQKNLEEAYRRYTAGEMGTLDGVPF